MKLTHNPQQARSIATQKKLLDALSKLLRHSYFENITTKQIADEAGLTPGTVYRRFKDKDAMLPVLYQQYDDQIQEWSEQLWDGASLSKLTTLESRMEYAIRKLVDFYEEHKGILRTLHLYSRLRGELTVPGVSERRESQFRRLLDPVFELADPSVPAIRFRMLILVLLSSIHEQVLYKESKPACILALEKETFIQEIVLNLTGYLSPDLRLIN